MNFFFIPFVRLDFARPKKSPQALAERAFCFVKAEQWTGENHLQSEAMDSAGRKYALDGFGRIRFVRIISSAVSLSLQP